jgi:hypothetical protein
MMLTGLGVLAAQSVGASAYTSTKLDPGQATNLLEYLLQQQGSSDAPWIQTAIDQIRQVASCGNNVCTDSVTMLLSPAGVSIAQGNGTTTSGGGGEDEPVVSPN